VSEITLSDDEDESAAPVKEQTPEARDEPAKDDIESKREEPDDEDTASDSWSECDSSDDDDHALVRTVSGRPITAVVDVKAQEKSNSKSITEIVGDYFQFDHPVVTAIGVSGVVRLEEAEQHGEDYKKDAVVSVTAVSAILTPPTSPSDGN
jgi:hypothetical protein